MILPRLRVHVWTESVEMDCSVYAFGIELHSEQTLSFEYSFFLEDGCLGLLMLLESVRLKTDDTIGPADMAEWISSLYIRTERLWGKHCSESALERWADEVDGLPS